MSPGSNAPAAVRGLQSAGMKLVWWYLLAVNGIAFAAMGIDKFLARSGRRRIAERTLHSLALVGGIVGSFAGIQVFRHKSQKRSFLLVHGLILVLQAIALLCWWQYA